MRANPFGVLKLSSNGSPVNVQLRCSAETPTSFLFPDQELWLYQFLGVLFLALEPLYKEQRVCACGRHVIGDHLHTCKKHTGSTKAAHETILDALHSPGRVPPGRDQHEAAHDSDSLA